MKKVVLLCAAVLLVSVSAYAAGTGSLMVDPGSFELSVSSPSDPAFTGSLSFGEVFGIHDATGLFASFSPFHLDMTYSPHTGESEGWLQEVFRRVFYSGTFCGTENAEPTEHERLFCSGLFPCCPTAESRLACNPETESSLSVVSTLKQMHYYLKGQFMIKKAS